VEDPAKGRGLVQTIHLYFRPFRLADDYKQRDPPRGGISSPAAFIAPLSGLRDNYNKEIPARGGISFNLPRFITPLSGLIKTGFTNITHPVGKRETIRQKADVVQTIHLYCTPLGLADTTTKRSPKEGI